MQQHQPAAAVVWLPRIRECAREPGIHGAAHFAELDFVTDAS
jgi:hypothetical protein